MLYSNYEKIKFGDGIMNKTITQGTIISSLRSKKYLDEVCFGVIITARCDLANKKVNKVFFLEALALEDWVLSKFGMQCVLKGKLNDVICNITNALNKYGLDWETLKSFSDDEVKIVLEQEVNDKNDSSKINDLYKKYKEISNENTNKNDRKKLCNTYSKLIFESINKIVNGQDMHYVYIPSDGVSSEFKRGLIVDLQEVDYLSLEEIEDLCSYSIDIKNSSMSTEKKEHYNDRFYIYDGIGYTIPICDIKSPWLEYLMQHFSNVFSRIGIDTPSKDIMKQMITEIYSQEIKI